MRCLLMRPWQAAGLAECRKKTTNLGLGPAACSARRQEVIVWLRLIRHFVPNVIDLSLGLTHAGPSGPGPDALSERPIKTQPAFADRCPHTAAAFGGAHCLFSDDAR